MIRRHIAYAKYLLRHKYWVFVASRKCDVSMGRALVHDLSKLKPSEWLPYARTFYKPDGRSQYLPTDDFQYAWLHHQKANRHHWQYWVLTMDTGLRIPMRMPMKYVREMVADWMGAGRAITGKWETLEWYENNKGKMTLHPKTQDDVEIILYEAFEGD